MAPGSDEGLGFGSEDIDVSISALPTEVELLKRAWRNEKASLEILQFQEDVELEYGHSTQNQLAMSGEALRIINRMILGCPYNVGLIISTCSKKCQSPNSKY
ncbi:hypothetical protein MKW92_018967, partial [Papaver armeniacum]